LSFVICRRTSSLAPAFGITRMIVVWTALPIKPNECPTPADGAVHLRIRVDKVS
jgi:hypothetical protein